LEWQSGWVILSIEDPMIGCEGLMDRNISLNHTKRLRRKENSEFIRCKEDNTYKRMRQRDREQREIDTQPETDSERGRET
jgi:hypothetical protein